MDDNQKIAAVIAVIVALTFFGGWYLFFGQIFNSPAETLDLEQIKESNAQLAPSGIITETATNTIILEENLEASQSI